MNEFRPQHDNLKLSWSANAFIEKPSSKILAAAITLILGSFLLCILLSFFIEIEMNVKTSGEVDSLLGVKEAVSAVSGEIARLTIKDGDPVELDQVIGYIRMNGTDEAKLNELLKTLEDKAEKLKNNSFRQSDLVMDGALSDEATLNSALLDVGKKLSNVWYSNNDWKLKASKETAPLKKRSAVISGQLTFVSKSKLRKLLEMQRQALEEENGRLIQQIATIDNLTSNRIFEAELDAQKSIENATFVIRNYVRSHQIRATIRGKIAKLLVGDGSVVKQGQVVANILPEGSPMVAKVYIPTKDIPKVQDGNPVYVSIDAYPSHRFGYFTGKVLAVEKIKDAATTSAVDGYVARISIDAAGFARKPAYAALSQEPVRLLPGMKVEARIITRKASIISLAADKLLGKSTW